MNTDSFNTAFQNFVDAIKDSYGLQWSNIALELSVTPTLVGSATSPVAGEVWEYNYKDTTYYRLVPTTYSFDEDAFYTTYNGTDTLSGLVVRRTGSRSNG